MTDRERALLELFETMRRSGETFSQTEFVRRAGYANRSALRHFPTLRRLLNDHTAASGRQRIPLACSAPRDTADATTEWQRALNRALVERDATREQVYHLENQRQSAERECKALRGLVSGLIAYMAQCDVPRAVDIERQLLELASTLGVETETQGAAKESTVRRVDVRALRGTTGRE